MARDLEKPLTRRQLNAQLVGNALTTTWPNVLLPAALALAGLLLGLTAFALPIAVVAWVALSAITYFDEAEAGRVADRLREGRRERVALAERVDLSRLAPPIAEALNRVLVQEQRIREAIDRAELPFEEVSEEVEAFVRAAQRTAGRAELLHEYLADEDPDRVERRLGEVRTEAQPGDESKAALAEALAAQLEALRRAERRLAGFHTEMERVAVELGNVRGQLLSVSASSAGPAERDLAGEVRDLRERVGAVAQGMYEVLEETSGEPA